MYHMPSWVWRFPSCLHQAAALFACDLWLAIVELAKLNLIECEQQRGHETIGLVVVGDAQAARGGASGRPRHVVADRPPAELVRRARPSLVLSVTPAAHKTQRPRRAPRTTQN